jgi:N-acetylglucosaminyl-diphospho-decaprenol L-rhamnosyltransferase
MCKISDSTLGMPVHVVTIESRKATKAVTDLDPRNTGKNNFDRLDSNFVGSFFNPDFYCRQLPDCSNADDQLLFKHYLTVGWLEGLDPCSQFSTCDYLNLNPDVQASGMQPLLHYLIYGINEKRQAKLLYEEELQLAEQIFDETFYMYRYGAVLKDTNMLPLEHFIRCGWLSGFDPNPFTHLLFVKRHAKKEFACLKSFLLFLSGQIFHNILLKKPAKLSEIKVGLEGGVEALSELFKIDIERYCKTQHDVLRLSHLHPIEHLFWDGLYQNRLRNDHFISPYLQPIEDFDDDYSLLTQQGYPQDALSFFNLDLGSSCYDKQSLTYIVLGVGIVLYKNSRDEIERLLYSVQSNLDSTPIECKVHILDNSPVPLDLSWVLEDLPELDVRVSLHSDNIGFSLGHNALMAECFLDGSTHYMCLNPDGYLLAGAIAEVIEFYLKKNEASLVELICEPVSHPKWYHPVTGETDWISGSAFILNKEAFQKTGGFDPNFPMYCEDVDLSFRAHQAGIGLYVASSAKFYHDISNRVGKFEAWRNSLMTIGASYLCQKWGNLNRAELLISSLKDIDVEECVLPKIPEPVKDVCSRIQALIKKDIFARRRF